MLQAVALLLPGQGGHDGCPVRDVNDHQAAGVGQAEGDVLHLLRAGYPVGALAAFELSRWADVAQFTDAVVAVVVGLTMHVRHGAVGLAEAGERALQQGTMIVLLEEPELVVGDAA